jgi:MinD superfamily P-loop ATPase
VIAAVLSGKGGTGKTTVATSLARAWVRTGPVLLVDCDAEGPNAHHFLPDLSGLIEEPVRVPVPLIDERSCSHCGACADACAFHALAVLPRQVLVFESLCHGCGSCTLVCPEEAVRERARTVGAIRRGACGSLRFVQGVLDVGEARSVPVIEAAIARARADASGETDFVLDGPPGASCPVSEVARAADVCLLITEPTPFGLHDLEQAHELVRARGKPCGVILNRAVGDAADGAVEEWCRERRIPLLLKIPDRRSVAEAYARGIPLLESMPEIDDDLVGLRDRIRALARNGNEGVAA